MGEKKKKQKNLGDAKFAGKRKPIAIGSIGNTKKCQILTNGLDTRADFISYAVNLATNIPVGRFMVLLEVLRTRLVFPF